MKEDFNKLHLTLNWILILKTLYIFIKRTPKLYLFLVKNTILTSDKSSRLRKNLLEIIKKLVMAIDAKIIYKKCNVILIGKLHNCQRYDQVKLINMNIIRMNKYSYLSKVE